MRIHYFIHAEFEKLGAIKTWAEKNKHSLTSTNTYKNERLPELSDFDLLIIMGGPQNACELENYAYLKDEVNFTQKAIKANKAILGICLGAQIIGEALGAKTEKSPNKEIGIFPVQLTNEGKKDPLFQLFSNEFDCFHWHNDMPGISPDSVLLAKSTGCPRQAFRYGDRVYGFQFHLEMTPTLIKGMVDHCSNDLQPARFIQSAETLCTTNTHAINQKMHITLDYFAKLLHYS